MNIYIPFKYKIYIKYYFILFIGQYYSQEHQKNELNKLNDQLKNVVDINEHKQLKHDFEALTAKHREILHLVLFKVFYINYRHFIIP